MRELVGGGKSMKEIENPIFKEPMAWYALRLKDHASRMNSQSGGALFALARHVIDLNGVVYGCVYEGFDVIHTRITSEEEISRLRGSKYVQSNMKSCFREVYKDLQNNKVVLFTGTPCQCAGIITYIQATGISTSNLFTCDFICHGVPSPKVYYDYLRFMEKKSGKKLSKINLRDKKEAGWHNHVETISFEDGTKYIGKLYVNLFYSNFALRRSCEVCRFTRVERVADITVSDCWGIEKTRPDLWDDNEGISMALIQTEKGRALFEAVLADDYVEVVELSKKELLQPQMQHPSPVPYQKERFWDDYSKYSFEKILRKYTEYGGIPFKAKRKLLKILKRW